MRKESLKLLWQIPEFLKDRPADPDAPPAEFDPDDDGLRLLGTVSRSAPAFLIDPPGHTSPPDKIKAFIEEMRALPQTEAVKMCILNAERDLELQKDLLAIKARKAARS